MPRFRAQSYGIGRAYGFGFGQVGSAQGNAKEDKQTMNVTDGLTKATSVPKRCCPPFVGG